MNAAGITSDKGINDFDPSLDFEKDFAKIASNV